MADFVLEPLYCYACQNIEYTIPGYFDRSQHKRLKNASWFGYAVLMIKDIDARNKPLSPPPHSVAFY